MKMVTNLKMKITFTPILCTTLKIATGQQTIVTLTLANWK